MATVSAHIAVALAGSAEHVFGVMGNGNAYFLDALLQQTDVPYTAVRHEAAAVVAADAYHRAGGHLAAATCTYGPGFTNTLTSLAESAQARVPLVLVTGDAPSSGSRPWDVDQEGIASALDVRTFTVTGTDAAATTMRAVEHALTYREPVVLAVPYDLARQDAGELRPTRPLALPGPLVPESAPTRTALDEAADLLARAERPLLLAGRGAHLAGAAAELGRLADATGAITVTTALARNLFPRPEYDLGVAGGFGAAPAMALVRQADVVVVFGASLNQFTMRFGELFAPDAHVVQVDVAGASTYARAAGFIRGDAALVAAALTAALAEREAPASGWRESVDVAALRRYDDADEAGPDGLLDPRAAARRIAELLPEDRVVVCDGGHFLGWANMYWPVAAPDRMVMVGTAYQSIGQGFGSVPGAAVAKPEATVVLSTGDGGGLMALADLETAVRVAGGRGMAVVWNDRAYGAEVHLYGRKGLAREPMQIPEINFAALAAAVGGEGVVVRTLADLEHLARWTEKAATERPFLLLDLRISGEVVAPFQHEVIRVNS